MGQIVISDTPIQIILEHDDVPETPYPDDPWGIHEVYEIKKVLWAEVSGIDWLVHVIHPDTGREFIQPVPAGTSGSKNLPGPQRFLSYPMNFSYSLTAV